MEKSQTTKRKISIITERKRLNAGTVSVNINYLTGTVPENKNYLTGTRCVYI